MSWFRCHYVLFVNLMLSLFILLSIIAPVFMHIGWEGLGKLTYWTYGKFCHQLAYRSFFIFGEQAYYPKDLSDSSHQSLDYQEVFGYPAEDVHLARSVLGSTRAGYKIALCQRDLALYCAFLVFGILFALSNKKIKPLPIWVWIVIGVLPIALDGLTQLGVFTLNPPGFISVRESSPALRVITGGLFGTLSAWVIFPLNEKILYKDKGINKEV